MHDGTTYSVYGYGSSQLEIRKIISHVRNQFQLLRRAFFFSVSLSLSSSVCCVVAHLRGYIDMRVSHEWLRLFRIRHEKIFFD